MHSHMKVSSYQLLIILLSLFSSGVLSRSGPHSPFLGVPSSQKHVSSEGGRKFFRLEPVKTKIPTLRKIEQNFEGELEDLEPEVVYPDTWSKVKSALWGDEEEKDFEDFKQTLTNRARSSRLNLKQTYDSINWDDLNTIYMMTIYVGSEVYEMSLVMDTGSSWMIAMSVNCQTCAGEFGEFDEDDSSTFERDYPYFYLAYGSAQAYGYYVRDQVWLDDGMSVGVTEFPFYLIDLEAGLTPLSGILGFSRDYSHQTGYVPGPLYYHFLHDESQVTDLLFATYFSDADLDDSWVEIGSYDDQGDSYEGDLVWIDVQDSYFWMTTTKGAIANGKEIAADADVILDTGTSLNYISEDVGTSIQKQIGKGFKGIKFLGSWYMKCKLDKYDPVFLELGGYYFEVPAETYIFDFRDESSFPYNTWCFLGFTLTSSDEWLLGEVFFRNYYTVWDEENSKVGLAIKKNSYATIEPYAS